MKRATDTYSNSEFIFTISIHALVKRATTVQIPNDGIRRNFNPRPREEGDFLINSVKNNSIRISIHALVKRATTVEDKTKAVIADFNPRPREEGDKFTKCFTNGIK